MEVLEQCFKTGYFIIAVDGYKMGTLGAFSVTFWKSVKSRNTLHRERIGFLRKPD